MQLLKQMMMTFKKRRCLEKNVHTTLKAVKEDTSAPDFSNLYLQAITIRVFKIRTSAPVKASKKYQDKVDKTEALKKEKEKNKATGTEQKQVRCTSCGGTDHSRSFSKLCPMNKSKTEFPKPRDTIEKTSITKESLANTCRYPKFVTLIQEVIDHVTQLVYTGSIFANYYLLGLLTCL
ncbi:hypothetical protein BCV72DRAFT_318002 [Rhizopus microsporus var. microsporus]|uniref:Uncharacterized protein n=2 Tax=Rhizopus microsporus TaxID=58291 RepID=A0A2G4T9J5_RHIZD|nr:uncharacterized protein RHIMIDRAFT_310317 [Rhizopus microsporus ATCC 52813]ORE11851.1 hypothetical protein BCV72DRAFT_318002 [Rhizopus microsporus var. microsporus]PHZ17672.1 hypothetical protein RHIMIDRAFT_310317 [Rhizopus microsporus ATCC 52813]